MKTDPRMLAIGAILLLVLGTLAAAVTSVIIIYNEPGDVGVLPSFSSKAELEKFLERTRYTPGDIFFLMPRGAAPEQTALLRDSIDYSTTNVQVAGIDEADSVKTDGKHIYLLSTGKLTIIEAYSPEDLSIVSVIYLADLIDKKGEAEGLIIHSMQGIFVNQDRLVVISQAYDGDEAQIDDGFYHIQIYPRIILRSYYTLLSVFDIEEVGSPRLLFTVGMSGHYSTSRMIGDKVYLVSQSTIWRGGDDIPLPEVYDRNGLKELDVGKIHYDPETIEPHSFVNLMSVDIGSGKKKCISVVADYSSTIYMSHSALYLTFQKWVGSGGPERSDELADWSDSAVTTIYKIAVQGLSMGAVAFGDVKGWLLNQFSMDEHDSHLRVATTTSWTESSNNVYVLDSEMSIVGSLEQLAPTERIFAARFLGDTLYLVTFRQIDPFFVIDLSDPTEPRVLCELKIPGFSSYLHPVGDDHILGIGSENSTVKVSLFDVSDPMDPVEVSKVQIGEGYSYTDVGWDHKALLFSLDRELLVIPVYGYELGEADTGVRGYESYSCVLRVSVDDGVSVRGFLASDDQYRQSYRNLYIGDYLYTVSSYTLQVHRIDDLSRVSSLTYHQV